MASAVQKIILSASRDIPFNKLVLSQANVRRVKAGVSIEELAEDIAQRTLLQNRSACLIVRVAYNFPGGSRMNAPSSRKRDAGDSLEAADGRASFRKSRETVLAD
jgi:hypothetical protein